jgi:hypothetical protein
MIKIEINNVDRSDEITLSDLSITQNLTNSVDTAEFSIIKNSLTLVPDFGDDIVIYDGTQKIFAGIVSKVTTSIDGMAENLDIKCVDYTEEIDHILVAKTYTAQKVKDIIADMVASFAPGFTTNNVSSDFIIDKIVFNQLPISNCLKRLATIVNYSWYIDENKDVHFFDKYANQAPYDLTDTAGKHIYDSLQRSADGSQIANRIKVRGGEYDGGLFSDTITVSGNDSLSFKLPYKFSNLTIKVNGVSKNVGIDNIDNFTTDDVLYNYEMFMIRFQNNLNAGDKILFSGNPKTPVLAIAEDGSSVVKYGPIEKIIKDTSIASNITARKRAAAELYACADSLIEAKFNTYTSGLTVGMVINVSSTLRSFSDKLIIKTITFQALTATDFWYKVGCVSAKTYDLLDLLQKIIAPENDPLDETEVSEMLYAININTGMHEEWRNISPFAVQETLQLTELWMRNPFDPANISWVYGPYFPTSDNDPNRIAEYDKDSVYS